MFVVQQDCIGKDSCQSKNAMEDTGWLDKVVPDFISPFVSESSNWPSIRQRCDNAVLTAIASGHADQAEYLQLMCSADAANYHINEDLLKSLRGNGCGTQADWEKVAQLILDCIDKNPKLSGFKGMVAKTSVIFMRDSVRNKCLSSGLSA